MTDRRSFLVRLGILTAAAAVMDPAELIERLAPRRLYVPGADFTPLSPFGELNALMKRIYTDPMISSLGSDDEIMRMFAKDRRMHAGDGNGLIVSA